MIKVQFPSVLEAREKLIHEGIKYPGRDITLKV
jgi:hypothetical protein